MTKREKIKWFVVAGIVVVIALVALKLTRWNKENENPAPLSGTANQTQTYTKLVAQYSTRRIQFDALCQAIPKNPTYKNGTQVMFDNRSGDARTITIGGVKYYFPGYGYKILTMYSSTLPKTIYLSCGTAVNVGQILLQK